jgi:hypothetical protein
MKTLLRIILILIILAVLIQFVPYGRNHTNPPVVKETSWDSPHTRDLAKKYCFDCHSNETTWPWYSNIAPASWLVYHDVIEAQSRLNFSDCAAPRPGGGEIGDRMAKAADEVAGGDMPPFQYTLIHPKPTNAERQAMAQGFNNSPCK